MFKSFWITLEGLCLALTFAAVLGLLTGHILRVGL